MNIIKTFDESYISYNYREVNCVADYFANMGFRLNSRKTWFKEDTLGVEVWSFLMHNQTHGRFEEIPTKFDDASD